MARFVYRPKEMGRCTGCGRLARKSVLKDGPSGGTYGPECYSRAVLAATTDPFSEANDDRVSDEE